MAGFVSFKYFEYELQYILCKRISKPLRFTEDDCQTESKIQYRECNLLSVTPFNDGEGQKAQNTV